MARKIKQRTRFAIGAGSASGTATVNAYSWTIAETPPTQLGPFTEGQAYQIDLKAQYTNLGSNTDYVFSLDSVTPLTQEVAVSADGGLSISENTPADSYAAAVSLSDGVTSAGSRTFGFTVQAVPVDDFVPLRTLYVNAATGNDSYTITQAQNPSTPWATVGRAARGSTNWAAPVPSQAAQPGDLVLVASGIYSEDGYRGTSDADKKVSVACNPANSGTVAHPIKFQGVGLPQMRMQPNARGGVIGANGRSYIIWDGFDIDDYYCGSASDFGPVILTGNAQFCTIQNCRIQGHPGSYYWGYETFVGNYRGITGEDASDILIKNNKISRIRGDQNEGGILTYDCRNWTIEQNTITDCGTGIFIKGVHIDAAWRHTNMVIRRNLIYGCAHGVRTLDAQAPQVYQNIIRSMTSEQGVWIGSGAIPSMVVANNTIVSNPYGNWVQNSGTTNLQFVGNILASNSVALRFENVGAPSAVGAFNRNCYYSNNSFSDSTSYAAWQGLGEDLNSSTANPLFVNAAAYDYHLQTVAGGYAQDSPVLTLSRDILGITGTVNAVIPAGAYITGTEQIGANW